MTQQEIMGLLQAPFPPEEIEWRVQSCGVSANGKPWAMVICYIQARAVQRRLDSVFGWDGWTDEYRVIDKNIICRLGIKTESGWIYKENGATTTDIEAFKGGISGAFKRVAASGLGIGRYLYEIDDQFAKCQIDKPSNNNGWEIAKTKDKKTIYWEIPQLPSCALPQGTKQTDTPPQQKAQPTASPAKQPQKAAEPTKLPTSTSNAPKCHVCGKGITKSRYEESGMCVSCQAKEKTA